MADVDTQSTIARELGVASSTVLRAARRLGIEADYGPAIGAPRAARYTADQARRLREELTSGRRRRATPA